MKEQKIAFLDVMKSAIRLKGSCSDRDIKCYTLDYSAFSNISKHVIKVICHSRLAEECYNVIRVEKICHPRYIYRKERGEKSWINELKRHS